MSPADAPNQSVTTPHVTAQRAWPGRTRIKICGLTREEDVDAAVQAGADAVGFVLYAPSPRAVTAQRAAELAGRLPVFVTPVLLFVNESTTNIIAAYAISPGAMCQYHGDETPKNCLEAGLPFIRAARVPLDSPSGDKQGFDLVKFSQEFAAAQAILVDAHAEGYGGSGKTFNWNTINWSHPQLNARARLVLSGGLTPANVTDGILQVRPWAVDVSSGVEVSKGIKDPEKIFQFVAAVRRADEQLAKTMS
jgi:phosphoribosylanthranilate isomerase